MVQRGCLFAVTGQPANAADLLSSGIAAIRQTGTTTYLPLVLTYLAYAYSQIGKSDKASLCVGEAMTMMERSKERWCEPEINRIAGEIVLGSPQPDAAKAEAYFDRALRVARLQQAEVLGTPRRNEPCPPLARPGQGERSARTVGSGLWLVHRGVRHARSERGEGVVGAAQRVVMAPREGRLTCTLLSVKVWQSPEWLKS